ncbi:MAG TPA: pinensin family lanthipeptide [Longimicrobium sp.]|nr:pinensin family lanthipeptide [Longimicrobium sp.]
MRAKLTLKLDDLSVDSFETTIKQKARGTVFGEQCTCWTYCGQNTCPGCPTCDASCNGTCVASCNGTCNCPSGNATCAYSCNYTDCDCLPPTCQQTNCGMDVCCGI